ncbi:SnoaL-like domain-containing protein [Solimonas aquatica]|uniref:SnoaL-like domain-containing protein n=1 Tax=Solimonas aquatica TaxID=489703 RepID=A0A1H9ELC9_9GAMM|nr:nuclear transport factor 2 family protein [Solimonas aquatica]SEQ25808.1 SnoaL-like domain-containing protein [Solimonas aquatica]
MAAATLQTLLDQQALQALITAYAYAIDERDWDRLDAIFTSDAHIDYTAMGGIAGAYPEIRKWLPLALARFPGYMHLMGNCQFEISGDEASGKIACFNPMVLPMPDGGTDTMFLGLWYLDRYRRTAQGWRICERVERKSYAYNVPAALRL